MRQLNLEKEKKFNSLYTFTPEVYENKRFNKNENFDERLDGYQKAKNQNLLKIKKEM